MKSSQRLAKLQDWTGIRQHITHVSQCLGDARAAQSRTVESSDSGCAALGLHAVDQHGPAIPAQLFDHAHGVEEHEVQVVVDVGLVDEADIKLFGVGRQVGVADPAQRHDRIDPLGEWPQSADVAEPDTLVVGMPDGDTRFISGGN